MSRSVCALIPHFECEEWLAGALESLLAQTRPVDAIVVLDDASAEPPVDIVSAYRDVTLLTAADNGGPYRLVQAAIDATCFDAYLFQDADDWSGRDRVEVLLEAAHETGAELVGSHEVRVLVDQGDVVPVRYPLDVSQALRDRPASFPLLHPTSLVARVLVQRIGGFATGMRFSGDAEFLRRAGHASRVVNADHFGYFRRKRAGSLTTAPDTALNSSARLAVQDALRERAQHNADAVMRGRAPDLARYAAAAAPALLRHLCGPELGEVRRARRTVSRKGSARRAAESAPVFVVGPAGAALLPLAWALAQHPSLCAVADARWIARTAGDVAARTREDAAPVPRDFDRRMASAIADLAAPGGGRWVAAGADLTESAFCLARLFPGARFVHVVRDLDATLGALAATPTDGGTYFTPELAARLWIAATETGLDLEAALGSERVLRVRHDDLMACPDRVLRQCLSFVGERYAPECARPLAGSGSPALGRISQSLPPRLAARASLLAGRLREPQSAHPDAEAERRLAESARPATGGRGGSLVEKVRDAIERSVPHGSVVAVASHGDPRMVDLPGVTGWHFPQVDGGVYAGSHPSDSNEAIAHLEELRERGAEYLVIPATSLWWLTFYGRFRCHLDERYDLIGYQHDVGAVHRLCPAEPTAPVRVTTAAGAPVAGGTR